MEGWLGGSAVVEIVLMEQTSAEHDDEMVMYGISAVERCCQRGGRRVNR